MPRRAFGRLTYAAVVFSTIVLSSLYISIIKTETSHISSRKIMTARWISRVSEKFHLLMLGVEIIVIENLNASCTYSIKYLQLVRDLLRHARARGFPNISYLRMKLASGCEERKKEMRIHTRTISPQLVSLKKLIMHLPLAFSDFLYN